MITDENVTAISQSVLGTADNWDDSYAKDWLNKYFYPKLKNKYIISKQSWCSEITTDENSARTECTTNLSTELAYIGLITLDEYNLTGGSNSYLSKGQQQWTMTPYLLYLVYIFQWIC